MGQKNCTCTSLSKQVILFATPKCDVDLKFTAFSDLPCSLFHNTINIIITTTNNTKDDDDDNNNSNSNSNNNNTTATTSLLLTITTTTAAITATALEITTSLPAMCLGSPRLTYITTFFS